LLYLKKSQRKNRAVNQSELLQDGLVSWSCEQCLPILPNPRVRVGTWGWGGR